jgi:hypothetical protein
MRSSSNLRLTAVVAAAVLAITTTSPDALPMPRAGNKDLQKGDIGLLTKVDAVKSRLKLEFQSKKIGLKSQNRIKSALSKAHLKLMKNEAFLDALRRRDAGKVRQMLESKSGVPIGEIRFGGDSTLLLILAVVLIGAGIF